MPIRRTVLACAAVFATRAQADAAPVTIFAAASLTEALRDFGGQWQAMGQGLARLVFAASSTLARQIEQGAPADIFLSADDAWMDYAVQRDLIAPDSRRSPVGNTLVLVAPAQLASPITLEPGVDLISRLPPKGRLVLADPAHVPAGRYAEAALRSLGQWPAIIPRLVKTENVRAALLLVERGEAPLGIVYATDAAVAPGVRIIGTFPPDTHPPITYAFALTRKGAGRAAARRLFHELTSPEAMVTWARHGFTLPR